MPEGKLFEIDGHWVGKVAGSKQLYHFWYDRRNGEIRRRSLKTTDIGEAQKKLAEFVVSAPSSTPQDPDNVPLVFVLTHYLESHSDTLPSAHAARRACDLVMQFLEKECRFGVNVKTGQFSKLYQAEFAKWSAKSFNHSPSYVSRVLSVIAAACRFSSHTMLVKGPEGDLQEARLLRFVPEICYDARWLAQIMQSAEPGPRDYVPSLEELASLLDADASDLIRRYDIIALNTWARPEAIADIDIALQADFEHGLLDLNPTGRRQTKKRRPIIRLTSHLRGWFEFWGERRPLSYSLKTQDGKIERVAASHIKAQFTRRSTYWMLSRAGLSADEIIELLRMARKGKPASLNEALRTAEKKGIQRITRYTLRHFMATRVRGIAGLRVDREQRSLWLGHGRRDATSWYETMDPEFLRECALATCAIIDKLDGLTTRSLVPPNIREMRLLANRKFQDQAMAVQTAAASRT